MREREITCQVNGATVTERVPVRMTLADFLRGNLGLTGTHLGCEHGVCGACTVEVNGRIVRSCLMLACQVDGCEVLTIEGLAQGDALHPVQAAFWEHHALQCGFCTPGMIMAAQALLKENPHPDAGQIREAISGNLCRCTGYQAIVEAIQAAAGGDGA